MKKLLLTLITPGKKFEKRAKWLFPAEIAMVLYALFTVALVLFTSTSLDNPEGLVWWRLRLVFLTLALWLVYQLWPCRLMAFGRILLLLVSLSWWYPDTHLLNSQFQSLDHIFASADQAIFGFQPALMWSKHFTSPVVSELMKMGYWCYYLMFALLTVYILLCKYEKFQKVSFIILGSFFVYYVIFDLIPVAGPQYYYPAVGIDAIACGQFPKLDPGYFSAHMDCLPIPGWEDGIFHKLVQMSHDAGERPTAAFPSSHVGISTVCMLYALRNREWKYMLIFAIPYAFLCMGTVYIMAHYAVDAIAGFISAACIYFLMEWVYGVFFEKRK